MSPEFPFQNPELPVEARIDDLLSRLTLAEKIACLSTDPSVPRLGVRGTDHVEGLHGLTLGGPGEWGKDRPVPTTTFPQAIGLAETWDPEALREVARIEALETRYAFQSPRYRRGGLVVRAPNADLGRDPRWGRTEECYGEDAFFNATMAVAFVRGLQGDHPEYWCTAALLKHFLANSNEDGRGSSSSDFDERLFREYYSLPFFRAISEGGARAFMAAYNKYNGVPCVVHPMLKEIAIDEWQQDGILCTDGGAYGMLLSEHHYYEDPYRAAAGVIKAGVNQFLDDYRAGVSGALERQLISEDDVSAVLRGVFRVMFRLGQLDPIERVPYAQIGKNGEPEPWLSDEHRQAVRRITARSVVLLKNDAASLPLPPDVRRIAVVGPLADRVHIDWYSGTPPYLVTPLDGIRARAGSKLTVTSSTNNDTSDLMRVAREAEVVIVCVGNHPTGDDTWAKVTQASYGKEAVDRRSLELEDERLIQKVFAVNPRTIVVLISSFPYAINWTLAHVPAILHLTHNSQELGHALAQVVFGDVDPGGRLVQTWPRSLDQLPPMLDYDLRKGRTYRYFEGEPLFPFGFGQSYTQFRYGAVSLSCPSVRLEDTVHVQVELENVGAHVGDEVLQIYARFPNSKLERPQRLLCGFQRVTLEPGERREVIVPVRGVDLAHWDVAAHAFVLEPSQIELVIARSASDTQATVSLTLA
jgi:beta-glucosidase